MQKQMLWKEVVYFSKISSQKNFLRKIGRSKNVKKQGQLKLNVKGSTLWSPSSLSPCEQEMYQTNVSKPMLKLLKEW